MGSRFIRLARVCICHYIYSVRRSRFQLGSVLSRVLLCQGRGPLRPCLRAAVAEALRLCVERLSKRWEVEHRGTTRSSEEARSREARERAALSDLGTQCNGRGRRCGAGHVNKWTGPVELGACNWKRRAESINDKCCAGVCCAAGS